VHLDQRYYRVIADFEQRFAEGVPQMRDCTNLTIDGDVTCVAGTVFQGNVTLRALGNSVKLTSQVWADGIHILS
jgi:UTP--glucose-1-phosphate uridylyltransferase